jgi:hypothetical protein
VEIHIMKKFALGLAIVVVLIAVGVWFLFMDLDHLIKVAIEKYGTAATQSEVALSSVHLSLTSGAGSLNGLTVANPKGFSSNQAMSLGSISVQVETSSVTGNGPIIIKSIDIEKPQVLFELANNGSTNLQAIQNNTQAYANSAAGQSNAKPASDGSTPPNAKPGRKIIINDLVINNGQVEVSQAMLKGKQMSVPLPAIHLTGIGQNSGGATAAQVAEQVLNSISGAAARSALTELAKEKISGALGAVPGAAIGGAAVNQVGSQIKGIFGQ